MKYDAQEFRRYADSLEMHRASATFANALRCAVNEAEDIRADFADLERLLVAFQKGQKQHSDFIAETSRQVETIIALVKGSSLP